MPSIAYKYDVFISYNSEDRPWAMKLFESLRARGLNPFLDKERLEAGKEWESQLAEAIRDSHHLVVVWSDKAETSSWVRREIGIFDARSPKEGICKIFIVLEGIPKAYIHLEQLDEIKKVDAYKYGADKLDENIWSKVLSRIETSMLSGDASQPVLLAVMAMTRQCLQGINPDSQIPGTFKNLNGFLADCSMGAIKAKEDLIQYYGDRPEDWRPFGSNDSVRTIMDALKNKINAAMGVKSIRWQLIGEGFWADDYDAVRQEAVKLESGWVVVVIDPLSFYDEGIRAKIYNHLYLAFNNPKAVFIALPSFTLFPPQAHFRSIIKQVASQIFDHFYPNQIPNVGNRAYSNLNIADELDIKQYIMTTVGCGVLTEQREAKNEFIQM